METKYITIPFDIERAKRITNKAEDGKIVTRDGKNVRIVCFDVKNEDSILALVESKDGVETTASYQSTGQYYAGEKHDNDLMLSVPEWTAFKDGDTIAFDNVKDVFFIIGSRCNITDKHPHYYVKYEKGWITFGTEDSFCMIENSRLATDEEKQKICSELKKSKDPKAKEYLKRFFGIEDNKEYKFEPRQWVLCKGSYHNIWTLCQFSHIEDTSSSRYVTAGGNCWTDCIAYNEETKHLLGKSDNWEG